MKKFADFSEDDSVLVNKNDLELFIDRAECNGFWKYRYCIHSSPEETLHEMIIVTTKNDVKYPDKHLYTTESNIILKGTLLVVLFTEEGEIEKAFILSPENNFYFRCQKNKYHITIPLTDTAVYIEVKEGPFHEKSNVYPDWAPDRDNKKAIIAFNKRIIERTISILDTQGERL